MIAETTGVLELFYSYAHKDEKLRNELNKHLYNLKRQGLIVEWYDRDISAGTDWEQAIDTHLNIAQVILLLISPDFMASDYCYSIEMKRALERHEAGEARVIPIILKPVDWAGTPFSKLQVLPRNRRAVTLWKERNAAFLEIANDIRETLKDLRKSSSINQRSSSVQTQLALASSFNAIPLASFVEEVQAQQVELTSVWNVPYPQNLRFTGRKEILQQIHESFTKDTANSFKQPVALSGLGGMGKTQIALEYAYHFRDEYQVILWAKADSQEVLTSELVSVATLLKVPGQREQDQQYALAAVKRWLEVHANWLLILDNIEDLALVHNYLPTTTRGHILLTTNSQIMHGIARRLDIDKMKPEEGALLLLRRVGLLETNAPLDHASEQECQQATAIITTLGGHPLAIDQAGAYIEENGANLHRYPELYARRRAHLLKTRGSIMADHPESVTTTLSLSFEKVEQASQAALELLYCLAFLHPDAIPDTLLELCATQLNQQLQAAVSDTLEFETAIGELRKYSLVRRNPDGATLTIHRLVQDVLKDSMDEPTQRQWAERVVRAVNQAFPTEGSANWETSRQYLPHAQNCSALIETWHFAFPEAARLLYKAGRYLDEQGQYPTATALIRQSLAIQEQTVETQHHEVAESLNALAELFIKQGMYPEAEPLLKRALAIREQALGSNHPDTARSLNSLATLYQDQGHYTEAEPLFKRALAICEQVLGPSHYDTATSLHDLTILYQDQGRYTEIEPFLRRALAIYEQVLGPNHPDTAGSLNNLATLYQEQGHYTEAEPLLKRALSICEQAFGSEHPKVVTMLGNYIQLLRATNRKGRAAEMEARMNILRRNISRRNRRSVSTEQNNFNTHGTGESNIIGTSAQTIASSIQFFGSGQLAYRTEDQPWFISSFPQTKEIDQEQIKALSDEIDVVIITATDVELRAVMRVLEPYPKRKSILRAFVGPETYYLGKFGKQKAVVTKCRMGAIGEGSVILATTQAQTVWHPKAIIMVGIAFGKDPVKQKIGDVLVASQIISYEQQRVGEQVTFRGTIPPSNTLLLNRFENAPMWHFPRPDGKKCELLVGPILSGEKLIDEPEFKARLFQQFPQAIGGEMEGAGLCAASGRVGVAWILIKSICDWGDGKKHDQHQALAAAAATSLVHNVLSQRTVLDSIDKK